MILLTFQYKFTTMNTAHKIAIFSLCLLFSLSWEINCVSNSIQTNTEKNIQDRKEALPGGELDTESKNFELVSELLPSSRITFQAKIATELNFSKEKPLPQSVFLSLSNPPPELKLAA